MAYLAALDKATVAERQVQLAVSEYGPVAVQMTGMLDLGQAGLLEGGWRTPPEPEVLMDGEHTLERCGEVTEEVLQTMFNQVCTQRVTLV